MTVGQAVIVLIGAIGFFVTLFLAFDVVDVANWSAKWGALSFVILLPVFYGSWTLGRLLFPGPGPVTEDERCARCGSDLSGDESGDCPRCGAGV
jgi:hypothetical protein